MAMLRPGDVVVVEYPGVVGTKRRPAVVVSSPLYHRHRADAIVALLTAKVEEATTPTDHVLQDWREAGLKRPTAFRTFLVTRPVAEMTRIGRLSDRDWKAVQECLRRAIAFR